jgi:REP element-mobilizing transposase RayT
MKVIMNIFLTLLKTGLEKENIELHAYCLMPNHFHLLIVPRDENSYNVRLFKTLSALMSHMPILCCFCLDLPLVYLLLYNEVRLSKTPLFNRKAFNSTLPNMS